MNDGLLILQVIQLIVSGKCMLLGSVSSQQRFGVTDIKAPSACHSSRVLERSCYSSQVSNGPCYSSYTNQCYSSILQLYFIQKIAGKSIFEARGHVDPKTRRDEHPSMWERVSELALAPLFICFFPGPVLCQLGQSGVVFVLPQVLTPVLRPSFVVFSRAFLFLIFQTPPFWTPFPYSNYLTLPPQEMEGPILWEQGRRRLSGYFLLNWDGEGYWASPSCQSQASESLQRCPSQGE